MDSKKNPTNQVLVIAILVCLAAAVFYAYVYQATPFPSPWNDLIVNWGYFVAGILGTGFAANAWLKFEKGEPPRKIWGYFTLGLGAWAVAEAVWAIYYTLFSDVPLISFTDLFWLAGYPFFALALLHQFRLIYGPNPDKERRWIIITVAAVILLSLSITALIKLTGLSSELTFAETLLQVFYPLGDVALMVFALRLSRIFGRGIWGRAWIGLVIFVVADTLYSFLEISGLYSLSVENSNPLSMIADVTYFVAYLALLITCLSSWLLLRHGPVVDNQLPVTSNQ